MKHEQRGPFTIGELAERAEVTPRTIRYYVAEGLLPSPGGAGQQRVYSYEHLLRLLAIKRFKAEYLPLAEIRARLAALTLADLEVLARQEPPAPRNRALSYIDAVLAAQPTPRPAARRDQPHAQRMPPTAMPREPEPHAGATPEFARIQEPASRLDAPPASVWQRVVLAPGVELHYQPSGDAARDRAVARLIDEALRLFSPGSPDPGERSS